MPALSTADFHAGVRALSPRIAVFDCDGTLWSGDAGSSFMWWTIETSLVSADTAAWLRNRYDAYHRGEVSELDICGMMVQCYRGLRETDLRAAAAEFFRSKVEPNIFPAMLQLVTELQAAGTDIWAVSSTNDWVIEEGVKRFRIPANRVLAAQVECVNGLVTDRLLAVPTDEGKVNALHQAGVLAPHAVFGNSVHDAAMLAIARSPSGQSGAFAINPSSALVERAEAEGWPIFLPQNHL